MPKKKQDCCEEQFPDHKGELPRLNRISGQVEGIKRMIDERRYCPDILIQIRAIRSALSAIEANILEAHLDSCVVSVFSANDENEKNKKIAELKDLYKRFGE